MKIRFHCSVSYCSVSYNRSPMYNFCLHQSLHTMTTPLSQKAKNSCQICCIISENYEPRAIYHTCTYSNFSWDIWFIVMNYICFIIWDTQDINEMSPAQMITTLIHDNCGMTNLWFITPWGTVVMALHQCSRCKWTLSRIHNTGVVTTWLDIIVATKWIFTCNVRFFFFLLYTLRKNLWTNFHETFRIDHQLHTISRSALVQVMACRLLGTKPLPEPMLAFCQLDP